MMSAGREIGSLRGFGTDGVNSGSSAFSVSLCVGGRQARRRSRR